MFRLLIKRFVKNPDQTDSASVIFSYALLCSIVGIALNILLFAGKLFAGNLSDSVTITADAFNNLSDAVTTLATLFGFWVASYGPGKQHPFGHGRYEWVTGLFAGLLVVFVGFQLIMTSFDEILHPTEIEFSLLIAIILVVSILIKLYMYLYNRRIGKLIKSVSLQAASADCFSDAIATSAVLIASLLQAYLGWHIDGWAGLIVSALIIRAGLQSLAEVMKRIIGQQPDQDTVDVVNSALESHRDVIDYHNLLVHDYGFGRYIVTMRCSGDVEEVARIDEAINDIAYTIHEEGHTCYIQPEYVFPDPTLEARLSEKIADKLAVHDTPFLTTENLRITQTMTGVKYVCMNLCIPVTINSRSEQIVEDVKSVLRAEAPEMRCIIDTLSVDDFLGRRKLKKAMAEQDSALHAEDNEGAAAAVAAVGATADDVTDAAGAKHASDGD